MASRTPLIHQYAAAGDAEKVASELRAGTPADLHDPETQRTPLMDAMLSFDGSLGVVRLLVEHGADVNARVYDKPIPPPQYDALRETLNQKGDPDNSLEILDRTREMFASHRDEEPGFETVLSKAIQQGNLAVVEYLIDHGSDVRYMRPANYDALIDAVHTRNHAEKIPLLQLLISRGARLNTVSTYSESALRVSSREGRFDVVQILLSAGADPAPLGFTPFMNAIALGTVEQVKEHLEQQADLTARDSWERTPWLLSLIVGDVQKAKLIRAAGADPCDRGRCGATPLTYPILAGKLEMLKWLLSEGFDPNDQDEFGDTALDPAIEYNHLPAVRLLVEHGVSLYDKDGDSLLKKTTDPAMARLLLSYGADLADVSPEVRAAIAGLPNDGKLDVDQETYRAQRHRTFGRSNAEKMNFVFWRAMITSGLSAYNARQHFGDDSLDPPAVWCFSRYGQSLTELPDGRVIQISGEHEDHYDPDFCIYNDVVVHQPDGTFDIYGYPKELFPPTDFHTATLVGEYIYIVGNLGYMHERHVGVTPVFRLSTKSLEIERLSTTGEAPGWIHGHRAKKIDESSIRVRGGEVMTERNGQLQFVQNEDEFEFDTRTLSFLKVR